MMSYVSSEDHSKKKSQPTRASGRRASVVAGSTDSRASIVIDSHGRRISPEPIKKQKVEVESAVLVKRRKSMMSEGRRLSVLLNGTGGFLVPVQLRFVPGDVFGEERAFHNYALTTNRDSTGSYLHAPHTVISTAKSIILEFSEPEHLRILMKAYNTNLISKIEVLRTVSSFGKSPLSSVQAMAARCVRRIYAAGTVIANQGDMSDNVYFCVRGQMQITLKEAVRHSSRRKALLQHCQAHCQHSCCQDKLPAIARCPLRSHSPPCQ